MNQLGREKSPYLLQHAQNPVEWFPWGEEAFAKARKENKPIFLSIGYSTCHWCHVMAHESFENPRTAEIMNARFREHQSRSRRTARRRSRLHDFRAGNDRRRRLADERLAHAGSSSLSSAEHIFRRKIVTVSRDFRKFCSASRRAWKKNHAKIVGAGCKNNRGATRCGKYRVREN